MAKQQRKNVNIKDFDEYENSLNSITNVLGKQSDLYGLVNKKLQDTKKAIGAISDLMTKNSDLTKSQADGIEDAAIAYKDFQKTIAKSNLELKKGNITQSEYNDAIQESYKSYENLVQSISKSGQTSKRVLKVFEKMKDEMQSFNEAAKKSEQSLTTLGSALDSVGSSGIPALSEVSDLLKNIANKDAKGAQLAFTALGAAIGGLAANYFGAEPKAAIQAANDRKQVEIDRAVEVGKIENDRQFIGRKIDLERSQTKIDSEKEIASLQNDAAFAQQRAAVQFAATLKTSAAEFQAASKTALFGKGLGSVGYGAAQLQLAGISAETIASGMQAAANETGKMPTAKVGADMAILAARTGQSADSIASINDAFMRLDGVSEKTALNLQEGVRAMADKAGVNLGAVVEEMAGASKEMLGYQIKSSSALAKQVVFAKSMGVSFNEIAKAGQSMVLNYKDSIKAEMSLSAMLGKNVDLSEVRAKFASGDQKGALEALKAQGLNPADMDMFQQQQLQSALGGMDLTSLQKIATRTGTTGGELKAGSAAAGNQQFLGATQAAQATLNSQQAQIAADTAVIDARLSQQITDAFLASPAYKKYQNSLIDQQKKQQNLTSDIDKAFKSTDAYIKGIAESSKLDIERSITENLVTAAGSALGGVVGNIGGRLGQKVLGKTASNVGTKAVAKTGTKAVAKAGTKAVAKTGIKAGAKIGAKAVGKSLLKKIPVVGLLAGVGFGLSRLMDGDYAGAALELASGAAGTIPGIGTAASVGIDTALAAKDMGAFDKKSAAPPAKGATPTKATTPSAKPQNATAGTTPAKPGSTSVTTAVKTSEKWIQNKLTYMSGNLERIVDRTTKTAGFTKTTADNIKIMNSNTTAILNLTKRIEALTAATYQGKGNIELNIDGKRVAYSYNKYNENTRSTNPEVTTTPAVTTP
jgi:hypothetical protein